MVPARGYGDHHHQDVMALDWARAAQRMPAPSPKLQSTGPQRESGSVVAWRQPGEELWKQKWRTWTTAGAPSIGWWVTDRGGVASLLPYTPAGMTGSNQLRKAHTVGLPETNYFKMVLFFFSNSNTHTHTHTQAQASTPTNKQRNSWQG